MKKSALLPKTIHFVGKSNSGKTTIVAGVISELTKRGLKVAAVKHGHHPGEFDQPGKDSWRMATAGADAVGFLSKERTFMLLKTKKETDLADLVANFIGYDVVIVEGYKAAKTPKIEVVRSENGGRLICPVNELVAIAADSYFSENVPHFGLDDFAGLADFVYNYLALG